MDEEKKSIKVFLIMATLTVVLFLTGIFFGIAMRTRTLLEGEILIQARTHFNSIVMTRRWNAMHGGVYVEKREGMESNPYLENPDITGADGTVYTKKNPALMTREISEMMNEQDGLLFRITSLNPLNPRNAPNEFERGALRAFEAGQEEIYEAVVGKDEAFFRYMAPLYVERPCLKCHADQGYEVGNVRGGISIRIDTGSVQRKLRGNFLFIVGLGVTTTVLFLTILYLLVNNLFRKLYDAREEIRLRSITDGLTGITNRRHGMSLFGTELERSQRLGGDLTCVLFDIDNFKSVNDRYGHLVGDQVLRAVSTSVDRMKREYDIFCRFGGEEFLMVLPGTNPDDAITTAERIRKRVGETEVTDPGTGTPLQVTVSLGVTACRAGDESVEAILARADRALYRAKETGKDRVCTAFDPDVPRD